MLAYSATRPSIKAKIPKPTSAASMRTPGADAAPPLPSMDTSDDEGEPREVPELPPALEMPDIDPPRLNESVIAIENALLAPIPGVIPDTVEVSATSAVDPDSQLTEDGSQESQDTGAMESDDDEASVASGLSTASINSIKSLATTAESLESSGFTMVPTAEALVADFSMFWSNNSHLGFTAVMIAFLSFMYSRNVNTDAINEFFSTFSQQPNLRGQPIINAINTAIIQPTAAISAGGSLFNRISGGIRAVATTLASTLGAVVGANMIVEEPLTIDNVTSLLYDAGVAAIDSSMTVPELISQLKIKFAALKALYKIKSMRSDAITDVQYKKIQQSVINASGVLNDLTVSRNPDIATLKDQFDVIIAQLNPANPPGAGGPKGAGGPPPKGGKRQSQKKQKKQQKQQKQKQKKTQKQSHKKLSKSKRAKKAKQSKKANKKH